MNKLLNDLLEKYAEVQEEENNIKAIKEELKNNIVHELALIGETSYTTDTNIKGSVAMKQTVKYDDEIAIIDYLQNNGMSNFLKTVIDTSNFNKTLKTSQVLQESLKGKYSISESPALTVKRG